MDLELIIDKFLGEHTEWTGTATALFTELVEQFGLDQLPVNHANTLSRMLNHRSSQLLDRGISVKHGRMGTYRRITLTRKHPSVEVVECPWCRKTVMKIIKVT